MAVGSFNAVVWQPDEIISNGKLQTLADNVNWLNENSVSGIYVAGVARDRGIRIVAGEALIPADPKSDTSSRAVDFPAGTFTPGTKPIVTATPISANRNKLFLTIAGQGGPEPTAAGFRIIINLAAEAEKKDKLTSSVRCHWIAMGI